MFLVWILGGGEGDVAKNCKTNQVPNPFVSPNPLESGLWVGFLSTSLDWGTSRNVYSIPVAPVLAMLYPGAGIYCCDLEAVRTSSVLIYDGHTLIFDVLDYL